MKYLLITLACLPLFGNAQTQDTIKLPSSVAKQIVKDLVNGDSAKAELVLCNQHVTLLENKISLKDNIISEHVQKGILYEERIKNEQAKFNIQGLGVKDLQKQNKKLKVKLRFIQITGTAIIGALTYLYITK